MRRRVLWVLANRLFKAGNLLLSISSSIKDGSSIVQRRPTPSLYPKSARGHEQNHKKNDAGPPHRFSVVRGNPGDQRAKDQSADESTEVEAVIDTAKHPAKKEIEAREDQKTPQRSANGDAGQRKLTQIERRNQSPGKSEDRARSSHTQHTWIPAYACQSTRDARDQINRGKGPATVERLREGPKVPQAPHVKCDVENAAMQEHVRQQPPPVSGQCVRSEVSAEAHQRLSRKIDDRAAGKCHREKDSDVSPEQDLGQRNAALAALYPRRPQHNLFRFLSVFTALRRLMLHTPLADFFKRQRGKLPSTSNAVRHIS